jgi:lysophospholipase L1-like esterase
VATAGLLDQASAPDRDGPAAYRLLVLGDSAAAGVGVSSQEAAITGCLLRALCARLDGQGHGRPVWLADDLRSDSASVAWRLLARTGYRLANVVRNVERDLRLDVQPDVQRALAGQGPRGPAAPTDLVLVSAGINDVLQGTSPARWRDGLQRLADGLQRSAAPRRVAFSGIPRIQDFPLLPQPLAWYLGQRAQRLNRVTLDWLASQAPASWRYVKLDLPLTPDYLAHDGFHPNEAGCRLWCEQVMAVFND